MKRDAGYVLGNDSPHPGPLPEGEGDRFATASLPDRFWHTAALILVMLAAWGLRAAAAERRPVNLLILMTDQHRSDALGCAGNSVVKTPNLDRLAAGGTRFVNSFCVVPYCSPTRAAIVMGRYPSSFGLGMNIDRGTKTFEHRLREPCETYLHHLAALGYHCHQLGKWHVGDPAELTCFPNALDDESLPGRQYNQRRRNAGDACYDAGPRPGETEFVKAHGGVYLREAVSEAHRRFVAELLRKGGQDVGIIGRQLLKPEYAYESVLADYCIELLKRHRDEPFAITYSVSPPHAENVVPAPFYDMYDPLKLPLPATWTDHPAIWQTAFSARMGAIYGEAGFREYERCYYGQVSMMDSCMGRILQALDDLGLAERTLVIFTSDHGNILGQHGMMDKAVEAFYDDLMRVPLIVRLPGRIPAGKTCDATAASVDLAPTILDYLGGAPLAKSHGRSLRPFLDGAADDGRLAFGERQDPNTPRASRVIRTRKWKLCLYAQDGKRLLYDLQSDPGECRNLAGDPAMAPQIRELSEKLFEHMRRIGDPALSRFVTP